MKLKDLKVSWWNKRNGQNSRCFVCCRSKKRKDCRKRSKNFGYTSSTAIVDTNCDPDEVDYVIPGNDDAIRAVNYLLKPLQMQSQREDKANKWKQQKSKFGKVRVT